MNAVGRIASDAKEVRKVCSIADNWQLCTIADNCAALPKQLVQYKPMTDNGLITPQGIAIQERGQAGRGLGQGDR